MKVVVYAIAKNEAAFARRWIESMSEADEVVVLDTGSTDGTPQLLRELGAQVTEEEITPWRFDAARNRSLELVPEDADICVCTDLDELFHPGWRALLEAAWKPGCSQAVYRYTWNFREDGSEGVVFWYEKIHRRRGYRWPDGTAPDPDSLPPGDRRLPYALDTGRRTVARTSAAAVGYRLRQTGAPVRGFSELDPERL